MGYAMTSRNVVLCTMAASATLSLINSDAVANPLIVNAVGNWKSDSQTPPGVPGFAVDGRWRLAYDPGNTVFLDGARVDRKGDLTDLYERGGGGPVTASGRIVASSGTSTG